MSNTLTNLADCVKKSTNQPQPSEYVFLLRLEGQLKRACREDGETETMLALRMVKSRLDFWRKYHDENTHQRRTG